MCRAWSATSQLLWWDSLQELRAIVAKMVPVLAGTRPLMFTDMQCKGATSIDGSNVVCVRVSSGQLVPPELLQWVRLVDSGSGLGYLFEPMVYLEPGASPGVLLGLIGAPLGTLQGQVACRDGGAIPADAIAAARG